MARDLSGLSRTPGTGPGASFLPVGLSECFVPAIVRVTAQGRIVWTPQARQLLGIDGVRGAERSARTGLLEPLIALAREAIQSKTGTSSRSLDYSAGTGPALNLHISALRLPGTRSAGAILVLNDLTRIRRVEELLLQADRLANIGTLSASMAHEVRNALVASRTFVDLLLEKHQDSELAELVRREMRRIDDMVTRMLKHSSTAPANCGPLHVHAVLDNALRLLEPEFREKALEVERALKAGKDVLNGDENQLQQAFMNLLLNGCEAAPYNGRLRVETNCAAGLDKAKAQLCVTIADNGAGIAPENLPHVFQPFFTTKPDGTGLGLAVTRRIISEHGGTITVESRQGEGTSFRLFLPI